MKKIYKTCFLLKRQFFVLLILILLSSKGFAQPCSSFAFTYTTTNATCASNGEIVITVTGGSGFYNYSIDDLSNGTSTSTSSNILPNLHPGNYRVTVRDLSTLCTLTENSITVGGSYMPANFTLAKTDVTCAGNDGTLTVSSTTNGRAPFTFTIINSPGGAYDGTASATGNFTGLVPGHYQIQSRDACNNLQARSEDIFGFAIASISVTANRVGCDSADASMVLQDNTGLDNTSGTRFNGFMYGYVRGTNDTAWYTEYQFRFELANKRSVRFVTKDPCGNVYARNWAIPASQIPSLGPISMGAYRCDSTFSASITLPQNLTNPSYCLYNSNNVLIGCNSTGTFTSLSYGSYCIRMTDDCYDTTITRCFVSAPPPPSIGATIQQSNQTCINFTARVTDRTNLTGATYCLIRDNPTQDTVACNSTGIFTNVPYGNYCIRIRNNPYCYDTTISRCFTATRPLPVINAVRVTRLNCDVNVEVVDTVQGQAGGGVRYCLYDRNGDIVACNNTGIFSDVLRGNYCIRSISDCGDTSVPYCFNTDATRPSVGNNVMRTNRTCNSFTAYISDTSRLVSPLYHLLNNSGDTLRTDSVGIFDNLPYGTYCIVVRNSPICYDTTFTRCFTETRPPINLDAVITQSDETCTSFTATVTGNGLTSPTFYLLNSSNDTIARNTTGIFTNVPYGNYCVAVRDGCDTTIRICQNLTPLRGIAVGADISCNVGNSIIIAQMISPYSPYSYYYYHPDGRLLHSIINSWSSNPRIEFPDLPANTRYKVVGVDNCGQRDSAYVEPWANVLDINLSIQQRCPSSTWSNGSGDIVVTSRSSFFGQVEPRLIRKGATTISQSYSIRSGDTYTFSNLEPATYVIEYTVSQCNTNAYDTIVVPPYVPLTLNRSAIYQCDNNSFSVNSNVSNGIGPFRYYIIGSRPSTPSIIAGPQSSPFFTINNGTTYDSVALQVRDACNNSAEGTGVVLPLSHFLITSTSDCFFQSVRLTIDTIPNAIYQWYKKTSAVDSTLVGTGLSYTIPFMQEEDMATYVCKATVNSNCFTRLAYTTLDGDCGHVVLPVALQLDGKRLALGNELKWNTIDNQLGTIYTVERKAGSENEFAAIGTVYKQADKNIKTYSFMDTKPDEGTNLYRLKATDLTGKSVYSNVLNLSRHTSGIMVYPNPVEEAFTVSIYGERVADYIITLHSIDGREVLNKQLFRAKNTTVTYKTPMLMGKGSYILRITNKNTGRTENVKLLFK